MLVIREKPQFFNQFTLVANVCGLANAELLENILAELFASRLYKYFS
jgi:hypothetical protein